jgi:hypothetical protein
LYNESVRHKLVYRVLQYNGDYYLLSGLKVQDLNNMMFPVVIDPTLTVYASQSDGYIYRSSSNYNVAWSAEEGTVSDCDSYISVGQSKVVTFPPDYRIRRGFFIFNTSELPSNAYIDNATLSLYKNADYSDTDFTITVQNGQPDYPHDPLEESDYNKDYYSENGGELNTVNFVNGCNNITLTNLSWINVDNVTKLCLCSSRDINGAAPTGNEYVNVYSANYEGEQNPNPRPKLIITYRNQSKIMNTGSTNLSGFLNIQLQYYHEAVDDWLFVKDVINEGTPRYINAGEYLALDTIFNGLVNSTSDLYFWNGTYRVYVALKGPNGKVLKSDDETLIQGFYEFNFTRKNMHGWRKLMGGGFNRTSNIGVRGMTIFNGEMYVGTQNHNMSSPLVKGIDCNGFLAGTHITMANGSYKNIEDINIGDIVKAYNIENNSYVNANVTIAYCFTTDIVPDNYVVINGNLKVSPYHLLYVNDTLMNASLVGVGDTLVDVNGSNVTVTSSSDVSMKKELYNFEISVDPEIEPLFTPNNLTYFAEDLQVYPWGDDDVSGCCFDVLNWLINLFFHRIPNFVCNLITHAGCIISEGCDIWKYNFTNDKWTEVIGPNTIPSSGFNDTNNAGGDIAVFNNFLYFAAGNYNGVEIWRYNGSTWEQVVGPIAPERDSGFDDPENEIVLAMKVFTNETNVTHLYAGTVNFNWSDTGFCQIWRTTNGVNWEKVVDKGFRDNVTIPGGFYGVKNAYCWNMEIFQDKLYAGTFNIPVGYNNMGCQLWRSASGNNGDWEKVNLPDGNNTGQYMDGFGEPNPNYGIRRLVNWSNNLYVGIATSFLKLPDFGGKKYSCELWKYNGGSDWSDWECIVGDDSTNSGNEWKDGFGDYFNKYLWSLTECNNSLWAGTISVQLLDSIELPLRIGLERWEIIDFLFDTTGCKVWRYNGTDLTPIVNDIEGSEIGSGFGDPNTFIARYSIEYPEGSGHIVFGTVQGDMMVPELERRGCSVWMRYD